VYPHAEKYPNINPYTYVGNNPINAIDPDGRDIVVASAYQSNFNKALSSIFGNHASSFEYDGNGKLSFVGNVKDLNKDQKYVYNQMNKLMTSEDVTNVIYEQAYTVMNNNGNNITIDTSKSGGEGTLLKIENPIFENYIVIDPNGPTSVPVMEVTNNYYSSKGTMPKLGDPPNFKMGTTETNAENATWHGLGHAIYAGDSQDKVLNFDNRTRKMMSPSLQMRKADETHNKTVTKGTGAVWQKN